MIKKIIQSIFLPLHLASVETTGEEELLLSVHLGDEYAGHIILGQETVIQKIAAGLTLRQGKALAKEVSLSHKNEFLLFDFQGNEKFNTRIKCSGAQFEQIKAYALDQNAHFSVT